MDWYAAGELTMVDLICRQHCDMQHTLIHTAITMHLQQYLVWHGCGHSCCVTMCSGCSCNAASHSLHPYLVGDCRDCGQIFCMLAYCAVVFFLS